MNLQALLEPRSVAVIGASADPAKISGMIVEFLLKSGYPGRMFPINPRYENIRDLRCYPSVDALPETVDLVVCVVPIAVAFEGIEAAARRGVPFCLLMTGGFGEGRTGAEGLARRERLLTICRDTGMHVVGPNTVGMVNFLARLPLTFADWYARDTGQRGGVAIVTHSGSVGGLVFSSLQMNGIGVDYWIGLGNEATLATADFISHFSNDPAVHTVICYMEGVEDGRKFIEAATQARSKGKRIVVIKAGDNPESARSTLSHTGKNPTAGEIYGGVFRQLGVIHVGSLAELTYAMVLLSVAGNRLGPRVGIISASGGACSLIADHVIDAGLQIPELPARLQETLNRSIPEYGSSLNPVDLSADVVSRAEILHGALAALRDEESVDVWLVFGRPIVDRYHQALIDFASASGKAVIVSCVVPIAPALRAALQENHVAVLDDPELALRALARVIHANEAPLDALQGDAPARTASRTLDPAAAAELLGKYGLTMAAGGMPALAITVEQDREFGPVIAVSVLPAATRERRVVRALPASRGALRDVVGELAQNEGGLAVAAEEIEGALAAVAEIYAERTEFECIVAHFAVTGEKLGVCSAVAASSGG
jgi:acyl-CoA synthetase (NDP forming)